MTVIKNLGRHTAAPARSVRLGSMAGSYVTAGLRDGAARVTGKLMSSQGSASHGSKVGSTSQ
jgi:hypothetical protein